MGVVTPQHIRLYLDRNLTSDSSLLKPVNATRLAIDTGCSSGKQDCSTITTLYIPQLGVEDMKAKVTLTVTNNTAVDYLEGLQLRIKTGNPDFVRTITSAKYFVFFLSLLTGYFYYRQWKLIPINLRVVEQQLILRQSALLLAFNDPFYALIFYSPNSLHIIFTSVATVAYYAHLLYLWLVVFEVNRSNLAYLR